MIRHLFCSAAALALFACAQEEETVPPAEDVAVPVEEMAQHADEVDAASPTAEERLDEVLAAQPEDVKARYQYRHPKETLMFFGIEPGMTVVDTLPGEPGWYGPILVSYLGPEGKLIGADYSIDMWTHFEGYATPEFLEKKKAWTDDYVASFDNVGGDGAAEVDAFVYGALPEEMKGTADAVLMFRAFHHFNRLEDEGGFRTRALQDVKDVLKPGGVVGVVQHRAPESASDEWAEGDAGYVKESAVIDAFENAGFELVAKSEINANPKDQPTEEDFVWRLPPSLGTSRDNPELKAQMEAIGESDRMTLLFRKPE